MRPLLAEDGDTNSQFKMGKRYKGIADKTRGYSDARKTAVKWFRLAAEQGHVVSQRYVGQFYNTGWGIKKDYKQAAKWFGSSAKAGDAESKYELGQLYEKGRGVSQDFVLAKKFYIGASNSGFKKAKNAIPLMNKRRIKIAQAKEWEEREKNSSKIKTSYSYSEKQELFAKTISVKYFGFRIYILMCRKDHAGIIPMTKKYMDLMRKLHAKVLGPHAKGKKWSALKDRAFELSNRKVEDWKKDSAMMLSMYASLSEDNRRHDCSSRGDIGNYVITPLRMENNLIQQKINKMSGKKEKRTF